MTYRDMVWYLLAVEFARAVMTALLALACAMAGLTLFRRPMWQ
ncbi:hypothetical protein SEA_PUREGLOBE5_109 [Arthrobacter phage Pureglobe5]|nr:hypothetical protein PBI_BEAGLE_111 [Arthrobacter phage Beagle]QOP66857.1 membrane protein [Arthrobacter phage Odyssey395]UYL87472.1 hypothetical protein SEA_PUREGLOBE5_109 [Arthrobacter phage Pureglobe5]